MILSFTIKYLHLLIYFKEKNKTKIPCIYFRNEFLFSDRTKNNGKHKKLFIQFLTIYPHVVKWVYSGLGAYSGLGQFILGGVF